MLVRDARAGLEVFLLRRTTRAEFAGGMHVFPGGRVDAADASPETLAACAGLDDVAASARLGLPSGGLGYYVAAIRESFEEAGVLLARGDDGTHPRLAAPGTAGAAHWQARRRAVHDGTLGIAALCREACVTLAVDELAYVSHWITPVGEARRFDTRFFVARTPADQVPLHDAHETVASRWVAPAAALAEHAAGRCDMYPPTSSSLEWLAAHDDVDAVLAAASAIERPVAVLPRLRVDAEGRVVGVAMPGEPGDDELDAR
jgi:8-oxo-dGTP pyrophosphatase MutT (NUDIX family)